MGPLAAALPSAAFAAWPDKPIRIVLPVAPGAAFDALARNLAAHLATRLGQPVIVDAKPGANGIIATDAVAKAPRTPERGGSNAFATGWCGAS